MVQIQKLSYIDTYFVDIYIGGRLKPGHFNTTSRKRPQLIRLYRNKAT